MKNLWVDIKENWLADVIWVASGITAGMIIKFIVEHM